MVHGLWLLILDWIDVDFSTAIFDCFGWNNRRANQMANNTTLHLQQHIDFKAFTHTQTPKQPNTVQQTKLKPLSIYRYFISWMVQIYNIEYDLTQDITGTLNLMWNSSGKWNQITESNVSFAGCMVSFFALHSGQNYHKDFRLCCDRENCLLMYYHIL